MSDMLLPIGSIIKMQDFDMPIMVVGFYPEQDGWSYDYLGVFYPYGFFGTNTSVAFDENSIDQVLYKGHIDDGGTQALQAAKGYMDAVGQLNQEVLESLIKYVEDNSEFTDENTSPYDINSDVPKIILR